MSQEFRLRKDASRPVVLKALIGLLQALSGEKEWVVEVKQYVRPRSTEANGYLWSCVYPTLMQARPGVASADEWHEFACGMVFGWKPSKLSGHSRPIRTTTTDENGNRDVLPSSRFWEFIEQIRAWAASEGVYVPDPNERSAA